jgi:phosphoribosylanthranilate isomerase
VILVKICGVTTLEDALVAADAGAGAIGLNFYPRSVRCVSVATAAAVCAALPPGVWRVGVFVDAPRAQVEEVVARVGLDTLQFHGTESRAYCSGWRQRTIKAVRVRGKDTLAHAADYPVDFMLADAYVEGSAGGTGQSVPPEWLAGVDRERLILAGGLTAENVAAAVRRVRPMGVDVASGVESTPGRKEPERVRRFIANAQNA